MIDGHMHLENGPLTKEYVYEFINEAKKKGLTTIQILDHTHRFVEFKPIYENLRTYEVQDLWLQGKTKFCNSVHEFIDLMKDIQREDHGIEVLYGLEVCYAPEYETFLRKTLAPLELDFVVGAIHSIDGILYDMNFSKELLWNVQDVNSIYQRYYELVMQLVRSALFTQLAHPDQLKLFNYYPTYDLQETYNELAKALVEHHVKAENNTGIHYRYHHEDIGDNKQLLQTFKTYGVSMITASDAHQPSHVGTDIDKIEKETMA
ncbi:histidinol phosphate phosphatase [Erysipelotrichaceae bacterium MTC7]|nr:histidinol phosphate phosphatase [Erysipelotrichaceae bacterium MTC7]